MAKTEKVEVRIRQHWRDHLPGDTVELDVNRARLLVASKAAEYVRKTDAKKVEQATQ